MKLRNNLSPNKFRKHITKEIQEFLDYQVRDINPRSPSWKISNQLDEINKKSGGIFHSRLSYKNRVIRTDVNIPIQGWTLELEKIGEE